ncbi:hypothetical protein M5D96_014047 [Drosophila gunungcola]|uniref:Uncharacterized protein n=1 Tax=Drosophila gunungcola TaxID=103775 RepID=A0A9P9YA40_9MUSC|nr:hypothetical protein M5D96_014047 [Drosophila gunungcola]
MAASQSEDDQAQPESMPIEHCITDLARTGHTKEPADIDFSMSRGRLAFLGAQTVSDSVQDRPLKPNSPEFPSEDPTPWLKCCGRNFMRSIFSIQPSPNTRPVLTRRRRGTFPVRSQNDS